MSETGNEFDENLKQINTDYEKCPNCGGKMFFDPDSQMLKCEYCGCFKRVEKNKNVVENDIERGFAAAEKWNKNEQATYTCENCGATIIVGADEQAVVCPYCGTSHVVKSGSFEGLRPGAVIPFMVSSSQAAAQAKKWAKKRIFAPRAFKKSLTVENVHGVYEPSFTFDSDTKSSYVGRVGDRHTRTVGSGKNRRTETYIVYRNVSGGYDRFFDDVTIAASDNLDQQTLDKLAPYRAKDACVYESKYLSGYVADGYKKDLKNCWGDAKDVMTREIRSDIRSSLHCDVVDYLNVSTKYDSVTFKYMLIPVYIMNFLFRKKKYRVFMNGSTAKITGKTPVSPWRVAIACILGAALAVLLVWLFYILQGE